ncbi:MAG: carboxypeptidase-like regulatory domain-containing protein [Oscillospiraceae bacterium]|nr:carboxypeptidase-like regulatory domain-containing protein [Oscillospiraceae bacterium]
MSAFAKFYFRPSKGEKIHTVVMPKEDESCGICGKVSDGERGIKGAFVLLFETEGQEAARLLASNVTDEDGQFAFGPLAAGELYVIKVYRDNLKLRELEITV